MTKSDLIAKVAKEAGVSKIDAKKVFDATFVAIAEVMNEHDRLQIPGFGSFYAQLRPARAYPAMGSREAGVSPEKMIPKFNPSQSLKDSVAK
ncbi:MAG: HU family DNA-binding protein [Oscillospiraceae bacterium]|nr:HU family DNA-binding protein [Oscillospiraceae bacterium]